MSRKPKEICDGCGADCSGWLCSRCRGDYRECRSRVDDETLEDDYSEDSDADSVCNDTIDAQDTRPGAYRIGAKRRNGRIIV